jgi:hypothetical protein
MRYSMYSVLDLQSEVTSFLQVSEDECNIVVIIFSRPAEIFLQWSLDEMTSVPSHC